METPAYHKLLARQIKKHLPDDCIQNDRIQAFIRAINESYHSFERDKELLEHSAQLNEREYADVNQKLKDEVNQRRQSVEKLIEAIYSLDVPQGDERPALDANNLRMLVDFLQRQIEYRKRTEDELRKAKELAEEGTRAKSEFLSMMSHEIRTPLNAIVGMTYLLLQEEKEPRLIDHLKTLHFSTEHLYALINDLLDFSKIEAGKVELEEISFDFKLLISNIKRAHQPAAEERGNRIRLMIDDDVPDSLVGDPLRIGQVLTNLVSNAIKFTEGGQITIELSLLNKNRTHALLYASVTDSGIGIPANKQQAIFEMFTQANSATTRKYGGTGLGLVITKRLLQLHGSDIFVESEEGKGAKFYFTLNLPIGEEVQPAPIVDAINNQTLKGVRILLVEDYPINVKVATQFLERWGVSVTVAENGLEALERFDQESFDLVLMDLQMPIMDGYTATEEIRKRNKKIPIIALTASASFNNKDRALHVGINDYVTKPFNPKDLFKKIAHYHLNPHPG